MSNKALGIGLLTLVGFPIFGFLLCHGFDLSKLPDFLQMQQFQVIPIGYGGMFGFIYAFIALPLMQAPVFDGLSYCMETLIGQLKLTFLGGIFLSVCAGVGEELFFRAALQPYLGVWLSSVIFVAIHGYLNPWNWRFSLYGLIILPFIVLLSYGFEYFGLWFAIAAHFAYDAVLFTAIVRENRVKKVKHESRKIATFEG